MLIAVVALGLYLPIIKAAITQIPTGTWAPAGNGSSAMSSARSSAATVQLQDGRLLITGGNNGHGAVSTADFFSLAGNFAPAPAMNLARTQHTATVLQDGTVLVAGGIDATGAPLNSAEIFDPSSGTWIQTGSMLQARSGHTATPLSDGTVLIAGGVNGATVLNSLEIYNPATGTFTFAAGVMSSAREAHATVLLEDGSVLIVGGWDGTIAAPLPPATTGIPNVLRTTDIYDPTTGLVSAGPSLNIGRMNHTATTQLDGKVFVVGGNNGVQDLASAEIFDPTITPQASSFTTAGVSLTTARSYHSAFLLPHNGGTLIVSGTSNGVAIASGELYMPVYLAETQTATLNPTPNPMSSPRAYFTGSPLSSGNVNSINDGLLLVAGGADASGNTLSSSELYGFTWVKTDAPEYAPGTPVNITGGGFQPGETVTLHFQESPYFDTHPDLTALVQADGTFSNSQFSPDIHDVDISFYLTATGSTSGWQAQTVFADASPTTTITIVGSGSVRAVRSSGSETISSCSGSCTFSNSGTPQATCSSGTCTVGWSANYNATLTATASSGSTFIDWSGGGGCSGSGTCSANATGSNGFAATATFNLNQAPAITSASSTIFIAGSAGSFTVADTGTPTPTLSESGTLPAGVTFNASNGVLSGTATVAGTYSLTFTASNGVLPNATQNFTLTVAPGAVNAGKSAVSVSPASVTADGTTTSTITVTLEDANNNPVSGKTVAIAQGTGHSTIAPASGTSNASGQVTFSVKDTKAEVVTYTATDTTDPVTVTQTATVTFTAGAVSATVSTVSANPASVTADGMATSTITVTLLDSNSNPVSGKSVTLAQGTGHSTISPASGTTNANGIATFAAKDTKAESVNYTATDTTDPVTISQTATVTFTAGPASATVSTVAASPTSVTADGSTTSTITVTLLDANSNPASGRTVTLAQGTGHSTISPANGASNSSGIVTFTVKDTKAEAVTYTATDTADSVTISQTATVTFTAGPVSTAVSTVVANPASVVADGSTTSTITVTLLDSNSNPVSGKAVSLTAGSGSSTINAVSGTTNAGGQATFTVKDTAVESVTYTAKDSTDSITITPTATVSFTVGPVSAGASTVMASPTSVVADGSTSSTVTVTLFDGFSHPVSGRTVSLTQGTGNSTITPTSAATNVSGQATFTVKDTKAETVTYTAKDTTDNVAITQTAQVTFTAGTPTAANSTVTANPISVTADGTTTSTVTVTLEDAHNNPVSGKTVTLAQGGGSSTISPSSATTNGSGVATFTTKDTKAEPVIYAATDSSDTVTLTQTATITFTPGALAKFVFAPISSPQTAGTAFNVTITAEDANGNTVTSFSADGNAVMISSTGTLSGGTITTASFTNGVLVNQPVTITNVGNFTLTAASNAGHGNSTGTSNSITVNPGAATHFTVTAPASATAGTPISFTVTALDAFSNTATGYLGTAHFTSTDTQAVLPANYTFAAGDSGVHTFNATLETAGARFITGTDTTIGTISGTSGSISVGAATPASIAATAGTPQNATINTAFAINLGATVKDAFGNLVSGATVIFAAPGSGASGTFAGGLTAATTNSSGVATAVVFTANGTAGSYNVSASVTGVSTPALFSLTNNNPVPTLINISPVSGIVTQTLSVLLTGTNFLSGVSSVSFGADITVNSVTVNNATQITASITIPSSATLGAHTVSVTNAAPGGGTASLVNAFNVTGTPPQITSGNSATFTAGSTGSFIVTATGTPTPSLSESGALPSGVTFVDNGNGTATLAGTTTKAGIYAIVITAQNGLSPKAVQNFTLTVNAAPLASITLSPSSQTITAGGSAAFTAEAFDQFGNSRGDVTGATAFSVTNGACTMNSCGSTVAGAQTVTGNDSGIFGAATLNVLPGPIARLALTPASISIAAGSSQAYAAMGFDAYNNAVGDVTGSTTFTIAPDGSCTGAGCTANIADINGSVHTVTGTYNPVPSAQGTANLTITAGSFAQLQLLVPGETAAPGTTTGKTGTPSTEYVNGQFLVTVNAVDQYWNVVSSVNDAVQITSNDPNAVLPSDSVLANGTGAFNLALEKISHNPATTTLAAADVTNIGIPSDTSPVIPVIVVYTAGITPATWATGQTANYTLTINNAVAPNTNNLASVEIAVPQNDQGTIVIGSVIAANGGTALNWSYDASKLPATLRFYENTPNDAVAPGGTITITFTASSNVAVSSNPVAEIWNTNAFSDIASNKALPLAPPEPTVNIGTAPQITSASSTSSFTYGAAGAQFTVMTSGVPTSSISEGGSFPAWATFTDNHDGTATISGKPTAAGASTFSITAHNGYGDDATQSFTLNVNKATATINVTPYSVTYDANPHTASGTATGVGGVDLSADFTLTGTTHTNAGTYATDAWSFHDATGNYADASGTVSDLIKQADAAITVTPYNLTYDANPHSATATATGVSGIDLSANLDLSHTIHTNASTYSSDYWTFTDPTGNYSSVAATTITDIIKQANAAITVTPYSVTYDATAHTATATATGVASVNLNADLILTGTTHTDAGTYASDVWSFHDATGNYADASGTISDLIKQANAAITVTPYSVTYDATPHTATATATGVGGVDLSTDLTMSGTTHTNAGTYSADAWSFHDFSGNYADAGATITDVIKQANATVTVTSYSVTYDANPHSATATASGVGGVNLIADLALNTTHTNAGTYATDIWSFHDPNGNYADAGATITDVISQAALTITPTGGQTKTYGTVFSAFTGTTVGLVGGNTITVTYASAGAVASAPVGIYDITVASVTFVTGSASNYALVQNSASGGLTVTAAAPVLPPTQTGSSTYGTGVTLTVTISAPGGGEVPTGKVQFQFVDPANSVTYNICPDGSLQAQTPPPATPCTVPLDGTGTASVTTTNLPAGMTADAITATYIPGDGNYLGGNTSINYVVSQASTQATLNILPAATPTYGDTVTLSSTVSDSTTGSIGTPTGTVQFEYSTDGGTTWINIGSAAALTPNPDLTATATATTTTLPAGTPTIKAVYSGDSNFIATNSGTTAYAINPKSLTVSGLTANDKSYDGSTMATLNTGSEALIGVIAPDVVTLTGTATGAFTDPNAGPGKTVNITGLNLTGAQASNYTLTEPTATASITKVQLTVTAPSLSVTYGDPVPTLTPTITGFVNGEGTGALSTQPTCSTTYTQGSNAGSAQTTSCSGAAATNYSFAYVNGTVTVNKANAMINVTPYTVTYDATAHTATGSVTGVGNVALSGLSLTGTTHTNAGDFPSDPWAFTDTTGNYNNANGTVHDVINKANATITVTAYSVTYDANPHTASGTVTGVSNTPLSGLSLTGTTHTNAGDFPTDPWTFTDTTGNYNYANGTVHDVINKANATINVSPYSLTYDANPHMAVGTAIGVSGETLSGLSLTGTTHTNAGDYPTDVWAFTDTTGNYNNANGTVHDVINKANATINVTPYAVTYDATAHSATGSVTGVGKVPLSGLSLAGTTHTNAGDYPTDVWAFTDVTGNYNNANGTVHDVINKANATISVTPYTIIYDAVAHSATGSVTGVGNVPLSGLSLAGTTHTNASDYPSDPWTFTDTAGNYNDANSTVHDVINKANAAISVTPYTVTYDANPHSATATATGVGGVDLIGDLTLNSTHTNAGTYSSDGWSFTDPTGNYNNVAATFITDVIKQANASINVTPYGVTYDGTAHTATGTATGVGGVNLIADLTLSGTTHINAGTYSTDAWNFHDPNGNYADASGTVSDLIKQANATIVVTPYSVTYDASAHTATGTATGVGGVILGADLTLSGTTHTGAGNYAPDAWSFHDPNGNYADAGGTITDVISQAMLTITASSSTANYGSTVPTTTPSYSGFVNGESSASLTAAPTCVTAAHGPPNSSPAGNYPTGCSGAADSNYSISYMQGSVTIQAVPLIVTASSGSMIYGGPVFPVTPKYSGFVNGDTAASLTTQPACSTSATSSTPVGAYLSSCAGAADSNYNMTYMTGSVSVAQASTTAAVVSSVNPSTYMQMVTLTATVTPQYSGTTPTGTVTFYNQGSPIGTGTLSVASCSPAPCQDQATFSTASLPDSGPDSILAVYGGDTNFIGSPSPAITQTVNPAPNVSLNPMSVSFGNQNVNTTSNPTTVTLVNIGDAALNISASGISITPNTDFFETNNCGSTVAAGKSCTITITFTPVDTGIRTASLQITDNDDDASNAQQTVALTGSGLSTITGTSLYTDAIFATANGCGSIVASGGSTIDSFSSVMGFSASHQLAGGNVGTNGNVTLNGSKSAIYGYAAVDSMNNGSCSKTAMTGLTSNGGAQLTGGLMALNGPVTYPVPPAPSPAPPTNTQNLSGSCGSVSGCTNNGSKSVSLTPGQYGNLTISGGTTAHVGKGVYNLNSLTLSGQSVLYVDSGPAVVNLAGASLSGSNPALDASGGSIQNPSGIAANLQITYAGSRGMNLTGGSGSYATIYAPGALVNMSGGSDFFGSIIASTVTNSGGTAVHYDADLPNIQAGNYIWFSAVVNSLQGLPLGANPAQVKLYLTNSTISFTANGVPYSLPVPNSVVTFNSTSATLPKTSYDSTNSRWSTSIPASKLTGNTFVTGIAIPVPAGGFPSGIQNVSWSAAFSTDTSGISLQWQWGAAVYSSLFNPIYALSSNTNALGVNAEDGSADTNGTDPAGTPETYKSSVLFGATGGGLTNYTGYLSSGAGVVPTIAPTSVSPSSLTFIPQSQGTTSGPMLAVITNNDSISHTIYSITTTGTNASDFTSTNTCPASLTSGAGCTITVTFRPSDVGTRTAKVVISEDAKNSPLTVYLSGTGQ